MFLVSLTQEKKGNYLLLCIQNSASGGLYDFNKVFSLQCVN